MVGAEFDADLDFEVRADTSRFQSFEIKLISICVLVKLAAALAVVTYLPLQCFEIRLSGRQPPRCPCPHTPKPQHFEVHLLTFIPHLP